MAWGQYDVATRELAALIQRPGGAVEAARLALLSTARLAPDILRIGQWLLRHGAAAFGSDGNFSAARRHAALAEAVPLPLEERELISRGLAPTIRCWIQALSERTAGTPKSGQ